MIRVQILVWVVTFGLAMLGCKDRNSVTLPEVGVFLTTDKTEYSPGEHIEGVLTNSTDRSIKISHCFFFPLQQKVDGSWLFINIMCNAQPPPLAVVRTRGTLRFSMSYFAGLPPGEYRLHETVCATEGDECQTVFSASFILLAE